MVTFSEKANQHWLIRTLVPDCSSERTSIFLFHYMWERMPSSPILNTYKNLVMTSVILLLSLLPYHCYLQNPGENIQGKEVIFFFSVGLPVCLLSKLKFSLLHQHVKTSPNNFASTSICLLNLPAACSFPTALCLPAVLYLKLGLNGLQTCSFQVIPHAAAKFISLRCKSYYVKSLFSHSFYLPSL